MALSNWDTLSVNQIGEPIEGYWKSPAGVGVEIYKNWVHIHDEKSWLDEDYMYTKPIIMKIEEGIIDYKDIHIVALRGPQNGIYIIAWTDIYSDDYKNCENVGIIGCGVSGYDGEDWVGVKPGSIDWLKGKMNDKHVEINSMYSSDNDFEPEEYKMEYDDLSIPNEFRSINFSEAKRYNQGDAFFAENAGTDLQATSPGEAKDTIASQILGEEEK